MPARPELVEAVIAQESGGNPSAISSKGARGLMQIEPSTAAAYGFDPTRLGDPNYNRMAGTRILGDLVDKHGGDEREALMSWYGRGAPPPGAPTTEEYATNVLKRVGPRHMTDREIFSRYKDYQDAASAYEKTHSYQGLSSSQQSMALDNFRLRYHKAMGLPPTTIVGGPISLSPVPGASPLPKAGPESLPSNLDEFGRERELLMRATTNHPFFHWLASVFPSDRPQAALDAYFAGSLFVPGGAEVQGASLGSKALGLTGRLAIPTAIGGAVGATESGYKATTGAIKGFGEQLGGEIGGGIIQGIGRLGGKPLAAVRQASDLLRIGKWLDIRFPGSADKLKNMADYARMFVRRGLEDDVNQTMSTADRRVSDTLVASRQARLQAERDAAKKAAIAARKVAQPKGVGDIALARRAAIEKEKTAVESGSKLGVTKAKGELQDLLNKELGSTESRMKYVFDAPGLPPRRSGMFVGDDKTPVIPLSEDIPDFIIQKWHIAGRGQLEVPFETASQAIKDLEKRGWDLAGHPIMTHVGREARESTIAMEDYLAEQVSKINKGAATEWLTARRQQKLARVMTGIFGKNPNIIDKATGNFNTEALMDLAKRQGFADDMRSVVGPEATEHFLDMLFRGAPPTATDIAAKPMTETVGIPVSANPLRHLARIYIHLSKKGQRVGNEESVERGGRYLTALMALGTGQFVQMLGDFVDWQNLPANQNIQMPITKSPAEMAAMPKEAQ